MKNSDYMPLVMAMPKSARKDFAIALNKNLREMKHLQKNWSNRHNKVLAESYRRLVNKRNNRQLNESFDLTGLSGIASFIFGLTGMASNSTDFLGGALMNIGDRLGMDPNSFLTRLLQSFVDRLANNADWMAMLAPILNQFVEMETIGGIFFVILIITTFLRMPDERRDEVAERVSENPNNLQSAYRRVANRAFGSEANSSPNEIADRVRQQQGQVNESARRVSKVNRQKKAESYLLENYNCTFKQLYEHYVTEYGSKRGTKKFKDISRMVLAKV